jgi:two-component system CheB/CheR fusion protein
LVNNKKVIQRIIVDITDRKRIEEALALAETRYHQLFESAKEGIFYIDSVTGIITDINPFLKKLLVHPKEEFVQRPIWEMNFLKNIISNKDKFKQTRFN